MSSSEDYVKWFRQASPYINAHRQRCFVLMLPGAAVEHSNFSNIIHDIALLHSLGVKLVVVHGARPQIERSLHTQHIEADYVRSMRVTTKEQLRKVIRTIAETRCSIEAALSTGLPNSPMHGAGIRVIQGNFLSARPWGVVDGVDLQHTGKVRRIDNEGLKHLLNSHRALVLVSPLGYSLTGEIFNLSFSEVATEIAVALRADKLIAYTSKDGYFNAKQQWLRQMNLDECQLELTRLDQSDEHSQSLQACFSACQRGVARGQMISYQRDGALLQELFTREGSGTLIHRDTYASLRRARMEDVGGLLELISPLEQQGILVKRSREHLEQEIHHFMVMELDGAIIACAALYPFDEKMAELACVITHPDYRQAGRAAELLSAIEAKARQQGLQTLFVLTTQTAHWFLEHGFEEASLNVLPEKKQSLYNYQRNSKIFCKKL